MLRDLSMDSTRARRDYYEFPLFVAILGLSLNTAAPVVFGVGYAYVFRVHDDCSDIAVPDSRVLRRVRRIRNIHVAVNRVVANINFWRRLSKKRRPVISTSVRNPEVPTPRVTSLI